VIREWLRPDGNTVKYDTAAEALEIRDSAGEIVDTLHPASEEERAEYLSFYPSASQDEVNKRNALVGQLTNALYALRDATSDGTITQQEFQTVNPMVQIALLSYRAFPYKSEEADRLAFLVLSQVSHAYSLLLAQGAVLAQANAAATLYLQTSITELQARVDALEAA